MITADGETSLKATDPLLLNSHNSIPDFKIRSSGSAIKTWERMKSAQVIEEVRSLVLSRLLQPHDVDDKDVDRLIRDRDGFIRMFCTQYSELNSGKYDINTIGNNIMETLIWRKASKMRESCTESFPAEMWNRNPMMVLEDDRYLLINYIMIDESRICEKWSDLTARFILHLHNKYSLEAAMSGKTVIMVSDASRLSLTTADISLHSSNSKLMDKHFPCVPDIVCCYGIPVVLAGVASFFVKIVLPRCLKKRFRIGTKDNIGSIIPAEVLPIEFGGNTKLRNMAEVYGIRVKSVAECPELWGFDEGEVERILHKCRQ